MNQYTVKYLCKWQVGFLFMWNLFTVYICIIIIVHILSAMILKYDATNMAMVSHILQYYTIKQLH